MEELLFTPASLIDLLSQIDELKEYDVGITETSDGSLQLTIGDSSYTINSTDATEIQVDEDIVETVEDVNTEAYENLDESIEVEQYEEGQPIESGIIKEALKALLLGGMIKLSSKLIK